MARPKRTARKPEEVSNATKLVFLAAAAAVAMGAAYFILFDGFGDAPAAQKPAILKELSRLAAMNAEGGITESDLAQLREMVKDDHAAEHEVEEIGKLVSYGESQHATHVFAFLASYIETGRESVCPGHALAHYYIFARHGDMESAEHGLEDAKLQMDEWKVKAREFNERFPGEFPFDYVLDKVEGHLASIEAGNSQATDEEIEFLAEKTICVDSDMDYAHSGVSDSGHSGEVSH